MIFYLILSGIVGILESLTSFLPTATTLPSIGGFDLDIMFSNAMGMFRSFMGIFPFLPTILTAFLFYLLFRIIMLTLRIFRVIR